jgi:uncharacterized protein with NRDE domain
MCTATWTRDGAGYDLFFNRDEKRTRKPGLPPVVQARNGMPFIAPLDGDAGGTWLAANANGVSVGILNFYAADARRAAEGRSSRGLLVLALADARSAAEASSRLEKIVAADYRPFHLLVVDPSLAALHTWDGFEMVARQLAEGDLPVTTSSFDTEIVVAHRRARLGAMRVQHGEADVALLHEYHLSREERGDAYSVLMRRPDAETVSISHVQVRPDVVRFTYWPRSLIDAGKDPGEPVLLARS